MEDTSDQANRLSKADGQPTTPQVPVRFGLTDYAHYNRTRFVFLARLLAGEMYWETQCETTVTLRRNVSGVGRRCLAMADGESAHANYNGCHLGRAHPSDHGSEVYVVSPPRRVGA